MWLKCMWILSKVTEFSMFALCFIDNSNFYCFLAGGYGCAGGWNEAAFDGQDDG